MRVGVIVVAYEAEATITELLDRVPARVAGEPVELAVFDDHSSDATAAMARAWIETTGRQHATLVVQDRNLGYGGNQKAAYAWAIDQGIDVVVLVHGDGQYPPERTEDLVAALADGADLAFGSRMIHRGGARRGGMPLVRRIGNRVLTVALNRLADTELTEWFSGFRAYRTDALVAARFDDLPDAFDFDTSIIFRLLANGARVAEIAVPTRYADEISRVPLITTGLAALAHGLRHRRHRHA